MTKNDYQTKMEESGLLMKTKLTHEDYMNELLGFQEMIGSMIFNDGDEHRINETIVEMERTARSKQTEKDPKFRKGIAALRQIEKEISISVAGKHGEERVARTLEYITRPCYKYRNVYITDGERETELDNLILTENGMIILEVKNVKSDITINENGRILYDNQCYHDISICDKMQDKRNLLKAEIEKRMNEKGLCIPFSIDSYLVLSTQRDVRIKVTDLCKKEKYCFRPSLPYIIDGIRAGDGLSEKEMRDLDAIICEMETQKKCFNLKLDFNKIRADIAEALEICTDTTAEVPAAEEKDVSVMMQKKKEIPIINLEEYRQKSERRFSADTLARHSEQLLPLKQSSVFPQKVWNKHH